MLSRNIDIWRHLETFGDIFRRMDPQPPEHFFGGIPFTKSFIICSFRDSWSANGFPPLSFVECLFSSALFWTHFWRYLETFGDIWRHSDLDGSPKIESNRQFCCGMSKSNIILLQERKPHGKISSDANFIPIRVSLGRILQNPSKIP